MNKYSEEIQQFTLMDDTFMSAVFDNKECAEILLNVILGKKLTVNSIKTQYNIQNLQGRSARLDIMANDTDGNSYNCEVENADSRTLPERTRYNSSLIDSSQLVKGDSWDKLPDTYVIMITKNDVLGGNKPIYHIERRTEEMDCKPFGDRSYIIYVNSEIQDDTQLGKLMHDFWCNKAENMYNKTLAERVSYFKNSEKGEFEMCEIMERLIKREREEAEKKATINVNLQNIKNIISSLDVSPQKAMRILKMNESEQDKYLDLLGLKP